MYQISSMFTIMVLMNGEILINKEVDNGLESMQSCKKKIINKCGIIGVVFRKNLQ